MKIMLIGSGGREHALAWKLSQGDSVDHIFCVPGNPGTADIVKCENVELDTDNLPLLAEFAKKQGVNLTVVGPEAPLVNGITDFFEEKGMAVFGPSRLAAQLEGSKSFSKKLMEKYGIPTAFFQIFDSAEKAKSYIRVKGVPIVVKADGLAAGKGVVVAQTTQEALAAVDMIMTQQKFGQAGKRVVVEEFMEGEEVSVLAFTDGETIVPMIPAQDHKRIYNKDLGSNTGGMGAYAPAPVLNDVMQMMVVETILKPTVAAMKAEGIPYKGCLYAGLMVRGAHAKVVEFNCRFGDPETQVILPLLNGDLAEIMLACCQGRLKDSMVKWFNGAAVCVVMASGGYPEEYEKGKVIAGLDVVGKMKNTVVFHAGTKQDNNELLTNGGRVLGVTAWSDDIKTAQAAAYQAVNRIDFEKKYFRKDIAWRALLR